MVFPVLMLSLVWLKIDMIMRQWFFFFFWSLLDHSWLIQLMVLLIEICLLPCVKCNYYPLFVLPLNFTSTLFCGYRLLMSNWDFWIGTFCFNIVNNLVFLPRGLCTPNILLVGRPLSWHSTFAPGFFWG